MRFAAVWKRPSISSTKIVNENPQEVASTQPSISSARGRGRYGANGALLRGGELTASEGGVPEIHRLVDSGGTVLEKVDITK
jgi:hypothetical protein